MTDVDFCRKFLYIPAMRSAILAFCLLLPFCTGCKCADIINFLLGDDPYENDTNYQHQAALNSAYQQEMKNREEKSKSWGASALP
jgi:hypothetical protein